MITAEEQARGTAKRRREASPASDANDPAAAASSASVPHESSPRRQRLRLSGSDKEECAEDASPNNAAKAGSDASPPNSRDAVDDVPARRQDELKPDAPPDGTSKADRPADEKPANRQDSDEPADEGSASDDESSSSSSSSSSSTTSSSSSISSPTQDTLVAVEPGHIALQEEVDDEEEEDYEWREEDWTQEMTEEQIQKIDFAACRGAQLRRTDLLWMLDQLPQEVAEKAIRKAWVRISLSGGNILAQVTGLVDVEPYAVVAASSDIKYNVKVSLKCRRCAGPEKIYKLTNISNHDIQEREFEQWIKLRRYYGFKYEIFRPNWKDKAKDFHEARSFKFDETTVSDMLRRKASLGIDLEFNAQRESKLRSEAQATLSQMELCGLQESRGNDLEKKLAYVQSSLEVLYQKSAKLQETWFGKRRKLYSLKEIDVKNKDRQAARDKNALNFTYSMDASDEEAERMGRTTQANVFQRRPCKPVSAWDLSKNRGRKTEI